MWRRWMMYDDMFISVCRLFSSLSILSEYLSQVRSIKRKTSASLFSWQVIAEQIAKQLRRNLVARLKRRKILFITKCFPDSRRVWSHPRNFSITESEEKAIFNAFVFNGNYLQNLCQNFLALDKAQETLKQQSYHQNTLCQSCHYIFMPLSPSRLLRQQTADDAE